MNTQSTLQKTRLAGVVTAILLTQLIFGQVFAQSNQNRPAEADKLHVVLLVAGHDSGIGNADVQDIRAVKQTINAAFASAKNRVVYHDLTGNNPKTGKVFTADEILTRLRNLKIGPNDNILVFHSGHGGITDKTHPEESHMLTVDGGQLARKEIRTILQAKRPRALMILTDCCSSFINGPTAFAAERVASTAPSVNAATVRNLLLKPIGLVNITAAQDGTEAKTGSKGANPTHAGSAFTVALTRLWCKQDVTYTSWEQMFPVLRQETFRASSGAHQARAFQIRTQSAIPAIN